ncbi:MAG: hypothetical protein ACT4TC_24040 [Myxococcaceae bacterium]
MHRRASSAQKMGTVEADVQAMREALEATLQSHVRMGKARLCDCSLCQQIREALAPGAGERFSDRLREECANIADWKVGQLNADLAKAKSEQAETIRGLLKVAREIGDKIRALKGGIL